MSVTANIVANTFNFIPGWVYSRCGLRSRATDHNNVSGDSSSAKVNSNSFNTA